MANIKDTRDAGLVLGPARVVNGRGDTVRRFENPSVPTTETAAMIARLSEMLCLEKDGPLEAK